MSLPIEMLIKSSLILAIAFALLPLLKRQSAAVRHWVLASALLLAALQPAMSAVVPALRVPRLAAPAGAWTERTGTPVTSAGYDAESLGVATETLFVVDSATHATSSPIPRIVALIWLAGAGIHLGVLLLGMGRLAWLRARATAAPSEWLAQEAAARRALELPRPVRLAITAHPALLVTYGLRRPVVLLPADAAGWDGDRIRVVTAHELAHLKRADWMTQLVAEVIRAVYWFHPLVWLAGARLRQESEQACDDIVLGLGVERTSYATHLVELARTFRAHGRTWLPAPAVARPSTLQRRVRAMLNPHIDRRPAPLGARLAIVFALIAMALPIAALTQPLAVVAGTLRDASERVVPNATVRLSAIGSDRVLEAQSDSNGRFQFPSVTAGEYLLSARHVGFSSVRQRLAVAAGETIDLALTLQVGTLQETIYVVGAPGETPAPPRAPRPAVAYTPKPCSPSEAGGNIVPPRKLRDVRPHYPQKLADSNVGGMVLLQARIGTDGKVTQVEPVSSVNFELEEAAIDAVSQWEFSPTLLNCEPIEVRMFVSVSFKAQG